MSSMPGPEETPYTRVSVEIPTEHAQTVHMMLRGVRRHHNLSVVPIVPPSEPPDMPRLFTMMEDERERLIPAVQRPHIRAFAEYAGYNHGGGLGEHFISGVWRMPRYSQEFKEETHWDVIEPLLLTDAIGNVLALRARQIPRMYHMLNYGHAKIAGVSDGSLGFLKHLSSAVHSSLFFAEINE